VLLDEIRNCGNDLVSGRLGAKVLFSSGRPSRFSAADFVPPHPPPPTPHRADVVHHAVHQEARAQRPFRVLVRQRNGVARRRRVTLRLSGQREVGYEPFDDGLDVNIQSTGDWLAQSS